MKTPHPQPHARDEALFTLAVPPCLGQTMDPSRSTRSERTAIRATAQRRVARPITGAPPGQPTNTSTDAPSVPNSPAHSPTRKIPRFHHCQGSLATPTGRLLTRFIVIATLKRSQYATGCIACQTGQLMASGIYFQRGLPRIRGRESIFKIDPQTCIARRFMAFSNYQRQE